ncbi:MAG TPA: hypothetical protein VFS43_08850 [Polyangiaceae bacterium]|nr:hypothetical protein [Polyangiaceae bacterium]
MRTRAYPAAVGCVFALALFNVAACGDAGVDDDDAAGSFGGSRGDAGGGGGEAEGSGGSGGSGPNGGEAGAAGVPTAVEQIAAGDYYTCVRMSDGAVRCWGRGSAELGYGRGVGVDKSVGDDEPASSVSPALVGGFVSQLSAGGSTCALFDGGGVRCWGTNAYGELGYGNTDAVGDDETPDEVDVIDLPSRATQVAAGASHTCALLDDGGVRCWGAGDAGVLGYVGVTSLQAPRADAVDLGAKATRIALGEKHSCALLEGGAVRCWGANGSGQLGYGATADVGDDEAPSAAGPLSLGGAVAAISAGGNHACALLEGGAVRCWGANGSGQLGYRTKNDVGDDELPDSVGPVDLGGVKATQLALGSNHTCALLEDGKVRCWGSNDKGQLGYGHRENIGDNEVPADPTPVDVGGTARQLAAGFDHTCALLADGTVRCWGGNEFGQLGYGHTNVIGDTESPAGAGAVPLD